MIIPLYSRKICSNLYPNIYYDKTAIDLISQIDYDFSEIENKSKSLMQRFGALEVAARQSDMIYEIKDYLKNHPYASIVNLALDLLDDYDHQTMKRPDGNKTVYILSYEECRQVIDSMKFSADSDLFGNEKDDSFKGSIGNIYQSFAGHDIYPTLEEKAANLLYFITKNHSFSDGNKRIAATMFLYFLDKNGILFADGNKLIDDHTLVALTIMIAESKPDEKEMMISVIMNCICG